MATRGSFTDVFIRHPVLAVVVNLAILLVGWRALSTLPVQQFPKLETSVVITTSTTVLPRRPCAASSPRPSSARCPPSAAWTTWSPPAAPGSPPSPCT